MPTTKNTTPIFLICLTLLSLMQGKALSKTCQVEQTHITLGDFFTWSRNEENYYTISTIVRGEDCNPRVKIYNGLQRVATYTPSSTIEFTNEDKGYSAVSYKFFIPKEFSTSNLTWKIKTTDDTEGMNIFPVAPQTADSTANWAVIGDMDISPSSQPFLDRAGSFDSNEIDGLIHVGDFAYNVHSKSGKRGDKFFQAMTDSFSKNIPYLVIAGNHESLKHKGKFFDFRFRMPGVNQTEFLGNHYYSFNYKSVHFVAIDWDYVFNLTGGAEIQKTFKWLENDLKTADSDHLINFKVFLSHRPFYCPQVSDDHCKVFYHLRPFEMMLRKYNVDLYLMAHEHKYYRLKKQQDFVNKEGATAEDLPLMIVNGAVGEEDGQAGVAESKKKVEVNENDGQEIIDGMTDFMYLTKKSAWLKMTTSPFSIKGVFLDSATGEVIDQFEVKRKQKKSDKGFDIF